MAFRIVLALLAAALAFNGVHMLFAPEEWYQSIDSVPFTGPFNSHFVRDIGSAFAVVGVALVAGALRPALRVPALALSALFYVLHALVHVTDTVTGRLPESHWLVDLPGVYLPAAVLVVLTVVLARRHPVT